MDIFDHTVHCNKCDVKMKKLFVERSGFRMRALECPECGQRTYHPSDMEEYNKFNKLKNQNFKVKLRQVGNSYAVSIPREILDFFREMDDERSEFDKMRESMDQMVTLALEQANKLSLSFNDFGSEELRDNEESAESEDDDGNYDRVRESHEDGMHKIVREKSETKPIKGGKGFISRKFKVVKMRREAEED